MVWVHLFSETCWGFTELGWRGAAWELMVSPTPTQDPGCHFISHLLAGKWELSGEMQDAGGCSP